MNMLDEGTAKRTSLQISDELAMLGASLGAGSNLDTSFVSLTTLKDKLDPALAIYADVILNPSFPEADFQRLQKLQIARIAQEKASPFGMALRVFPRLVYGAGHPYAIPFTGSGYADTVAKLTRADLVKFHQTWFKPRGRHSIVVGDTTMAEIKPKLESALQGLAGRQGPGQEDPGRPDRGQAGRLHHGQTGRAPVHGRLRPPRALVGRPGRRRHHDDEHDPRRRFRLAHQHEHPRGQALELRRPERPPRRPRPAAFVVFAPVQSDKTKETMVEIKAELEGILGKKPITQDEFAQRQEQHRPGPARPVGDHGDRPGIARGDRSSTASGRLLPESIRASCRS